jgi:pyridinium-3,5-bisthiocarboxylic acid mononucleotide nickel chelatase
MAKVAYFDCPTGIAGDMCLGALVDAGLPLDYLVPHLDRLGIQGEYQLRAETVQHNGQRATKLHVDLLKEPHSHETHAHAHAEVHHGATHGGHTAHSHTTHSHNGETHSHSHETHSHNGKTHSHETHSHETHSHETHSPTRHLPEIEQMILGANLPDRPTQWSLAIFRALAAAEGAVHGIPPEQVHFHEVGAVDAIVDIVGTCLGLDWHNIEQVYVSPLPTGGGTVWAAHGRLPVPVPAVLKLFEMGRVPVYHNGIDRELVTPTGAAIAITLAQAFGPPPAMQLEKTGLGAGTISLPIPNILRLWIGHG